MRGARLKVAQIVVPRWVGSHTPDGVSLCMPGGYFSRGLGWGRALGHRSGAKSGSGTLCAPSAHRRIGSASQKSSRIGNASLGDSSRTELKGPMPSLSSSRGRPRGPIGAGYDPSRTSNPRALQKVRRHRVVRRPYEGVVSVAVEGLPSLGSANRRERPAETGYHPRPRPTTYEARRLPPPPPRPHR